MRGYDTSRLKKQLAEAGYAKHVIPDEVQAYIVAPSGELGAASAVADAAAQQIARAVQGTCEGAFGPKIR